MDHGPDDSENETDKNQTDAESDWDQSDHEPYINDSENETEENQIDAEKKRRSFTKEFKLSVVNYFYKHGENNLKTSNKFNVGRKQVREWVRKETRISQQKRGTRSMGRGRNAFYAEMEKQLYGEFESARSVGKSIKRWWFNKRGRQILNEMDPDNNLITWYFITKKDALFS